MHIESRNRSLMTLIWGIYAGVLGTAIGNVYYDYFSGNWSIERSNGKTLMYDSGNHLFVRKPRTLTLVEYNPLEKDYHRFARLTHQKSNSLLLEAIDSTYGQEVLAYIEGVCPHFKAEEALRVSRSKEIWTWTLTGPNPSCISTQPQ